MPKSPWTKRRAPIDWPMLLVTGWIVVTGAVLMGSILSNYLGR